MAARNEEHVVLIIYSETIVATECGDSYDELVLYRMNDGSYVIDCHEQKPDVPVLRRSVSASGELVEAIFDYIGDNNLGSFEKEKAVPPDGKDIRLRFRKDDGQYCCLDLTNMPDGTAAYLWTVGKMLRDCFR